MRVFGRFHPFEEKKIVKTVNFLYIFQKMSSRRQAKLITSYRIPGFSFFISFRFQCNTCFKYAISCFAKAYCNNFASNFDKLQFVVSIMICQKASQGTISFFFFFFFYSKFIMLHMNIHISYKYIDNSYEFHFFIYVYNFNQIFTWKFYYFMGEGVIVLGSAV